MLAGSACISSQEASGPLQTQTMTKILWLCSWGSGAVMLCTSNLTRIALQPPPHTAEPPRPHNLSDFCKTGTVCPGNLQERLNTNKVDVSVGLLNKWCVLPSERSVYLACSAGEMFLDQSAAWTAGIQQWDNKQLTPAGELELHSSVFLLGVGVPGMEGELPRGAFS